MEEQHLYKELYYRLFNAITDSLRMMEQQNFGMAIKRLKKAQYDAEEAYISAGDSPKTTT